MSNGFIYIKIYFVWEILFNLSIGNISQWHNDGIQKIFEMEKIREAKYEIGIRYNLYKDTMIKCIFV